MKLDRLLNDFEFILKDKKQFNHLLLGDPCYIKIQDLRVAQINYDGFLVGEIHTLTVVFPDVSEGAYHLTYEPGMIEGIDPLDKLMNQYNMKNANRKEIFQKMLVFGALRNFRVRNLSRGRPLNSSKKETDVFKRNLGILETFLHTKKINKKLSYQILPYGMDRFHCQIDLKNGVRVFIRISSFDCVPKDSFDKISKFLSKEMENKTNKYGVSKTHFYFFQPIYNSAYVGSEGYQKMMIGSIKSLEEFLKGLSN